jgi:hypothetical protein
LTRIRQRREEEGRGERKREFQRNEIHI